MQTEPILIVGASTRAAAFSALRAGLRPVCIDLFADRDLQARCTATALPAALYPSGLSEIASRCPPSPWMYTGAIENWPKLVEEISTSRLLWGNSPQTLRAVRNPFRVFDVLRKAGLPAPDCRADSRGLPKDGTWLAKPYRGGGGSRIHRWRGGRDGGPPAFYFQEFIAGVPCAAIYAADGHDCILLGVSEQLVGEKFLHAGRFAYCGSVAPLPMSNSDAQTFEKVGRCLSSAFGLRGLFGIDAVLRNKKPVPVEVNPRYTASIEVLEFALGVRALAWHQAGCTGGLGSATVATAPSPSGFAGKAVWFAARDLDIGDLQDWVEHPWDASGMPCLADIPRAGVRIRKGRPVLTVFARGMTRAETLEKLRARCLEVEARMSPKAGK
ncbi:MAG: ATP-grasp domain-containing protein [Planctomycetes bacterium]|nr:ATP-grasp domain-containing protein [Planctomycetota bacterium]